MKSTEVVVVGAGWAGLTAASRLVAAGHDVVVLEKSRGPGGRSATRREGGFHFDHGAQYFTARSEAFRSRVDTWLAAGLVAEWEPRLRVIGSQPESSGSSPGRRLVAVPGMNGLLSQFSRSVECRFQTRVQRLGFDGNWDIWLDDNTQIRSRCLILTAPPAQSEALLGPGHPLCAEMRGIDMQPCWALMLGYEGTPDCGFDAAFVNEGRLAWLARNNSKPERQGPESWVVHASPDWSGEHLERSPGEVVDRMLEALCKIDPAFEARPQVCLAHRWRYALARNALEGGVLTDGASRLVVAGDWCAGNRIEGAWTSGVAAARQMQAMVR